MAYATAASIVQQASEELGLGTLADDVWANPDANVVQLRALLTSLGKRLVKQRPWTHLQKEYGFTTTGVASYVLPADFRAPLPRTGWDRSRAYPSGNALTGEEWQTLKASSATGVYGVRVRPQQGRLFVYPSTDSGTSLVYEYLSSAWVQPDGQSTPTEEAPAANADVCWFDGLLLMQGLKVAWLKAKGFDATAAEDEYRETLSLVEGEDAPPATLSLKGGSSTGVRLLDEDNVPLSEFGD